MDLEGPQLASLQALLRVLQAQGQTLVSPADRLGLHPLTIPLARAEESAGVPHAAVMTTAAPHAVRPLCLKICKEVAATRSMHHSSARQ